ncbi:hypothetical protein PUR71_29095 [Streptomyces sp. SP17BM10]|uniref:hypothetical protein n=1 Tax=Streptomyces sp. SP17BM10 TaxID=3002530 RepID=UPI002E7980C1|nr:hypothetical protein [Streptomyces sp. SP17BM10]MEE1786930.1 hypothetical protein [Streptomyces sp. SP17BM10]
MPQYFTVRDLLAQLQNLDPNLRVRLAVNPDWPFAHYVGTDVVVHDGIAYIGEDGQDGYLPPAVREHLAWA